MLALVGPANLMDIHPSVGIPLSRSCHLNIDWDFFWRHQISDGIYFPSGRLNVPGDGSNKRYIGHQPGIQMAHQVGRFLEIEASYFHFFTGDFLKEVTEGENFSQFGVSMNLKF